MKRLAILGASGHGRVIADAAEASGWQSVTFFDDAWPRVDSCAGWKVIGATAELIAARADYDGVIVGIGDNETRLSKHRALSDAGVPLVSLIHPAAVISRYALIGTGSVVLAGGIVNPCATLGTACIVNTGASVDHDCVLGDAVHISPGAHLGGTVRVGSAAWIGLGASVRHGIAIGARAIVGAGAVVVQDVPDDAVVTGNPARGR